MFRRAGATFGHRFGAANGASFSNFACRSPASTALPGKFYGNRFYTRAHINAVHSPLLSGFISASYLSTMSLSSIVSAATIASQGGLGEAGSTPSALMEVTDAAAATAVAAVEAMSVVEIIACMEKTCVGSCSYCLALKVRFQCRFHESLFCQSASRAAKAFGFWWWVVSTDRHDPYQP